MYGGRVNGTHPTGMLFLSFLFPHSHDEVILNQLLILPFPTGINKNEDCNESLFSSRLIESNQTV